MTTEKIRRLIESLLIELDSIDKNGETIESLHCVRIIARKIDATAGLRSSQIANGDNNTRADK